MYAELARRNFEPRTPPSKSSCRPRRKHYATGWRPRTASETRCCGRRGEAIRLAKLRPAHRNSRGHVSLKIGEGRLAQIIAPLLSVDGMPALKARQMPAVFSCSHDCERDDMGGHVALQMPNACTTHHPEWNPGIKRISLQVCRKQIQNAVRRSYSAHAKYRC